MDAFVYDANDSLRRSYFLFAHEIIKQRSSRSLSSEYVVPSVRLFLRCVCLPKFGKIITPSTSGSE